MISFSQSSKLVPFSMSTQTSQRKVIIAFHYPYVVLLNMFSVFSAGKPQPPRPVRPLKPVGKQAEKL